LNSVYFINNNTGWVVGNSGIILKTINGGTIGIQMISLNIPKQLSLYQNYPNPFNTATNIKFDIPKKSFVKLMIYNSLGKEVSRLVNEVLNAGSYKADWDANRYPSGVYFYRIQTEDFVKTKSLVLLK